MHSDSNLTITLGRLLHASETANEHLRSIDGRLRDGDRSFTRIETGMTDLGRRVTALEDRPPPSTPELHPASSPGDKPGRMERWVKSLAAVLGVPVATLALTGDKQAAIDALKTALGAALGVK